MQKLRDELHSSLVQFQTTILLQKEEISSNATLRETEKTALYLEIIEVLDAFDSVFRSLDKVAAEPERDVTNKAFGKVVNNFKAVYRKLGRILSSREVQRIEFADQQAVPGLCKVVETQSAPDLPEGHVLQVVKQGYQYYSKVIRPAEVITSSGV